jgi:hypothetical protein
MHNVGESEAQPVWKCFLPFPDGVGGWEFLSPQGVGDWASARWAGLPNIELPGRMGWQISIAFAAQHIASQPRAPAPCVRTSLRG